MSRLSDLLREAGTEVGGQADATAQLLLGMAKQPVAGLTGASAGIWDLLRGQGTDAALKSAVDQIDRVNAWGGPVTERGGQRLQELGQTIEKGTQAVGDALGNPIDKMGEKSPLAAAVTLGLMETVDPTKGAGRAAKAATKAVRKAAKSGPQIERSAAGMAPVIEAGEPDIARSIISEKASKGPTIDASKVDQALVNRAELRAEPQVLPKPGADMTPEEWQAFGAQHGVDLSRTPSQSLGISDLTTRKEIMVPGGLEGTFTLPDVWELKANNFDPGALPQDVHNQLMQKFLRTYERPGPADAADRFNALNFSLLSPNAPLTQNEFLAMRLRARGPEDIDRIASMSPEAARAAESGTGAASRGGMGVKGTADFGNMPQLARLSRDNPEMFSPSEGEGYQDVARRIMNQVPGLGPKTASLGVPFLDLAKGDTSAVDLHMIRNSMDRLMQDPELGAAFTGRLGDLTGMQGASHADLQARAQADPAFAKALEGAAIDVVSSHPGAKYRLASGEVNPSVHPAIQPDRLAFEPEQAVEFGPYYNRIVEYVNQSRGANPDLPLFPEQWRLWDTYRGRVEPHEMAHPDLRKLPKMSWEEMQASLQAHKDKGYTGTSKDPVTGELGTQRLKDEPSDWRKFAYFGIPGLSTAGIMAQLLREEEEQKGF